MGKSTVYLTSVDIPVPQNREFHFAHLQTIVWQVKKKEFNLGHSLMIIIGWDMIDSSLYILLKSLSSVCHLLSNLNFELLRSVTYVYLCAGAPCVDESWQRTNETHGKIRLTCHDQHNYPANIITMASHWPLQRCWFNGSTQSDSDNLFERGWPRALLQGFKRINKILLLLVFLTNRSPAAKNGCQNGIHCQRRAPITHKKVYKNSTNNNLTRFYIIWTITWYLAMVVSDIKIVVNEKCRQMLAILIAMRMWRYNAGHIARWSTSSATLEATGCCHRPSACAILPRRLPWLANSLKTHKKLTKHKF